MAENDTERSTAADDDQPTTIRRSERLPLLAFLNRSSTQAGSSASGFVGALIVGAIALVVALIALTVAIGRAPQDATAASTRPTPSTAAAAAEATSYVSPEQTGPRYTAEPIITGVPQMAPSYDPPTTKTPTPTPTPSSPSPTEPASATPAPSAPSASGG